jgi:hypothetical protein
MWLTDEFLLALYDYFYLADRDYPERGFLKLIGDRYGLSEYQRTILYRGVTSKKTAEFRYSKLISPDKIRGEELWIDGFNVLLTISSYLQGSPVFIAMDGFLRDAAHFRGRFPKSDLIVRSFHLLTKTLLTCNPGIVCIYLDENAKTFTDVEVLFGENNLINDLDLEIVFCAKVDKFLVQKNEGLICTSDTGIIDASSCKIVDLARLTLFQHFNPEWVDLSIVV